MRAISLLIILFAPQVALAQEDGTEQTPPEPAAEPAGETADEPTEDAPPPEEVTDKEAAKRAEYERLATNLARLAERNSWDGVEKTFQQLIAGKHDLEGGDSIIGAQSARTRGDVQQVRERLLAAKEAGEGDQAQVWLDALDENYRQVELIAKTGAVFEAPMRPFNPDYVTTIDFAASKIAHHGKFEGWLPQWEYRLADQVVKVEAGDGVFSFDVRKLLAPPPPPVVAPPVAVLPEPEPEPKKSPRASKGDGPNWVRVPLWTAAVVSAGFAGTYYGLGASSRQAWDTSNNLAEMDDLQFQANTYARWSAIAGGLAVGFGVGGALAGPKRTHTGAPR